MSRNRDLAKLPFETLGGTTGQLLSKASGTDYDFSWIDNYTSDVEHDVKAGENVSKGNAVYISSADGTNMIVTKADYTLEGTSSKTIGLMKTTLSTNGIGRVITEGLLTGTGSAPLNTSAATAGDPVWLGASGGLLFGLANKPYAPYHMVFLGIVTRSHAVNGEIFVKVQNGFELQELHNVSAQLPNDGNTLIYSNTTKLWESRPIPAVTLITASSPLTGGTITSIGTIGIQQSSGSQSGYLSANDWLLMSKMTSGSVSGALNNAGNNARIGTSNLSAGKTLTLTVYGEDAIKITTDVSAGPTFIDIAPGFTAGLTSTVLQYNGESFVTLAGSATGFAPALNIVGSDGTTTSFLDIWDDINLTGGNDVNITADTNINISAVALKYTNGTNYVGFQLPTLAVDSLYTLPSAIPSGNRILQSDSSGVLTWITGSITPNSLTFNNGGTGDASGTTFNGSAAKTISYNTIGAQPLSANLTSLAGLSYSSPAFVRMTGTNSFILDTTTYLTANQSITISGDISGTGTTAISASIGANKVTNAMLSQVATATFKGRTTAGTGNVEDLTATQATALLDVFTSTTKGLAPLSGGGTTNFLRADGTWAAPYTFSTGLRNVSGTITANLSQGVSGGQSAIGGTASGESLTLSSTSNATKGKILFGTSAYDEANNRLGIGTASPSCSLNVVSGTIADGGNSMLLTATMPTTPTATTSAVQLTITSAGSAAFQQNALSISLGAGFTGNSVSAAANVSNTAAGTGTGFITGSGNVGLNAVVSGTTTGRNIGGVYVAQGGDINQGIVGRAVALKNAATNIGVVGAGLNTGTTPIFLGGYFTCGTGTPTLTSAALMCDNDTQAVDIFVARDNGTKVWSIADGGNTTWADAINISFGATTGTKIGTANTQKIGFWNATPIVQPATGGTSATFAAVAGGSAVDTNDTFDGYTIGQVVRALRNIGILA